MTSQPNIDYLIEAGIEAEEAILGCLILDHTSFARLPNNFTEEWFFIGSHRTIYKACKHLVDTNENGYDLVILSNELASRGQLDHVGGVPRLAKLLNRTIGTANIDRYAGLLLDKYIKRQMAELGNTIVTQVESVPAKGIDIVTYAQDKFFNIVHQSKKDGLSTMSDVLLDWQDEIEEAEKTKLQGGLSSSYKDLHKFYLAFKNKHFLVIGARPGVGKTTFAINLARDFLRKKIPVAFFSFEMTQVEIVSKLMACYFNVPHTRCSSGEFNQSESEKVYGGFSEFSELPFFVYDKEMLTVPQIKMELKQQALKQDVEWGAVFIDYLQLMGRSVEHSTQEIGLISRQCKGLARELNCPVFALSQLNRASTMRKNKKPSLEDLRQSGEIEQDADGIFLLHRDDAAFPERPPDNMADLIIAKNRHGMTGAIKFNFNGLNSNFTGAYSFYEDQF